jgi:tetratricopeptide (TPR) repeat protein
LARQIEEGIDRFNGSITAASPPDQVFKRAKDLKFFMTEGESRLRVLQKMDKCHQLDLSKLFTQCGQWKQDLSEMIEKRTFSVLRIEAPKGAEEGGSWLYQKVVAMIGWIDRSVLFPPLVQARPVSTSLSIDAAEEKVRLRPFDYMAHYELARAYETEGKIGEMVEMFQRCRSLLKPKTPQEYLYKGIAIYNAGEPIEAGVFLDRAYQIAPSFCESSGLYQYYFVLTHKEDDDQYVVDRLRKAIKLGIQEPIVRAKAQIHLALFLLSQKGVNQEVLALIKQAEDVSGGSLEHFGVYYHVKGLAELVIEPFNYIRVQSYFDQVKKHNKKYLVEKSLERWFSDKSRGHLALLYYKAHAAATQNSNHYFKLFVLYLHEKNWKESLFSYHRANLLDKVNSVGVVHKRLFEIVAGIEKNGSLVTAPYLSMLFEQAIPDVEKIAAEISRPYAFASASILHLLVGNVDKALFYMDRAAAESPLYNHFLIFLKSCKEGDSKGGMKYIQAYKQEIVPLMEERNDDSIAMILFGLISLVAFQTDNFFSKSSLMTQTFLGAISKYNGEEIQIGHHLERVVSFFYNLIVPYWVEWCVGVLCVGIYCLCRPKSKAKVKKEFVPKTAPQPKIPEPEKLLPSPAVQKVVKQQKKEVLKVKDPETELMDEMNQFFNSSTVGLYVRTIHRNDSFQIYLDCGKRFRPLLEKYQSKYCSLSSTLFGACRFIKKFEDGDNYYCLVEMSSRHNRVIYAQRSERAKALLKELDEHIKALFSEKPSTWEEEVWDGKVAELNRVQEMPVIERKEVEPKPSVESVILPDVKWSEKWELSLQRGFHPFCTVSIKQVDENGLVLEIRIKEQYQEYFVTPEAHEVLDKIFQGSNIEVAYDTIQLHVPKGLKSPEELDLQPFLALIPASKKEEVFEEAPPMEVIPEKSIRSVPPVGYMAARDLTPDQIWALIRHKEIEDKQRITKLLELIQLLKKMGTHPDLYFARKYATIRFLEIYKKLTFWKLRPEEEKNAQHIRNAIVHQDDIPELKDHVFPKLVSSILNCEMRYQDPYVIHGAISAKYQLLGTDLDFFEFLSHPFFQVEAIRGSEEEQNALREIIALSTQLAHIQHEDPEILEASRGGIVLSIRAFLQMARISLETKKSLDSQLQVLVFPVFRIDQLRLQRQVEFKTLGDRLAHGDFDTTIDPVEWGIVAHRDNISQFIEVVKSLLVVGT